MSTLVLLLIISTLIVPAVGQTGDTNWFSKGMELYNQGKYEESLQAYNTALEADPGDEEAWNNKGIDLGLLGKYDEALQAFNNATSINSSYAEAWYNMGLIFDFQGKYGSAKMLIKMPSR
jgi:tetratricopeptide (TPR) repeat protein